MLKETHYGIEFIEGDSLIIKNNIVDSIGSFLGFLIRIVLNSQVNHSVMIVNYYGELHVQEAIGKGVYITKKLSIYLDECVNGYRDFYLKRKSDLDFELFKSRIKETNGKKYDFASLFWFHIIKLIIKKWLGHTSMHAKRYIYCSELFGYTWDLPKWWQMTPKECLDYGDTIFILNGESRKNLK